MASTRQHFVNLHRTEGAYHQKAAIRLRKRAAKEEDKNRKAELEDEANEHDQMAIHHRDMMEKCEKATDAEDQDLNKLQPSPISAITPNAPAGIRPVLRVGQPNLNTPRVEPIFESLVKVE